MVNNSDFGLKLLSTLTAYAASRGPDSEGTSAEESRLFIKAALALRAWYRHAALLDRPEMVVQERGNRFEVFGGTFIERQLDGSLVLCNQGRPENGLYTEVAGLGQWLARHARQQVQLHYLAKAQELVRSQELSADATRKLQSALELANDYVSYKLNVCWWRRKSTLAADGRILGKLLWDAEVIDRKVFSLAVRVKGFRFTVPDYNQCAVSSAALAARVSEAPHMAPWLVRQGSSCEVQVQDTVWKDLKVQFQALGGTPQAWKWLCNQGHTWFKSFRLDQRDVTLLNQLAALQLGKVPFHPGLMYSLRSISSYDRNQALPRYLDVFKAAVLAFKKRKLKLADFGDYNLIFDWLQREASASTKGATWASLMRKQRAWHMEFARQEMERRKEAGGCLGWAPYVQSLSFKDFEAISLNNSDELWEEGTAMSHCVGGYDDQCYHNISRIYSIRRNGEREATLEIRKVDGKLTIGQLYAYDNRVVKDVLVNKFAKQVLLACKREPEPSLSSNVVLREPKNRRLTPPAVRNDDQPQAEPQYAYAGNGDEDIPF
jgi:hypothetical protein